MANWFRKSAHIPDISSGVAVEVAPNSDHLFSRFWTRRMLPTAGGQNFHLGSQQLPRNSLSGPLPYNARQFRPLEPAPPYGPRRIVSLNAYGTGMANGQFISAPLVNGGEIGKALIPVSNKPFDIFGIRSAGRV
jgi:hypothetical protein